ncbi:MAG: hypothetical protein R2764_13905 [Bacteroidales bacterium]
MKFRKLPEVLVVIAFVFAGYNLYSQTESEPEVFDYAEDNQSLF